MIDITLSKLKYRNPNHRVLHPRAWETSTGDRAGVPFTRLISAGRFHSRSSNQGQKKKPVQGLGHRRRAGLGAVGK